MLSPGVCQPSRQLESPGLPIEASRVGFVLSAVGHELDRTGYGDASIGNFQRGSPCLRPCRVGTGSLATLKAKAHPIDRTNDRFRRLHS